MSITHAVGSEPAIWTTIVPIVVSGAALILSIFAFLKSLHSKKYDLYLEVLKSYNSLEMLKALRTLWDFIDTECGKQTETIIRQYKEHFHTKPDPLQLHSRRRLVSTYYQHLGFLYENKLIPYNFRRELPGIDLSIIEFLYPIEQVAIGEAIKEQNERAKKDQTKLTQIETIPKPLESATAASEPTPRKRKQLPEGAKPMYKMFNERFGL